MFEVRSVYSDRTDERKRLNLTDFRCYPFARLETDGRPVVLTGPNGAGKTNVLEAISFLAPGGARRKVERNRPLGRLAGGAGAQHSASQNVARALGRSPPSSAWR